MISKNLELVPKKQVAITTLFSAIYYIVEGGFYIVVVIVMKFEVFAKTDNFIYGRRIFYENYSE